jgi:hypothetical protein
MCRSQCGTLRQLRYIAAEIANKTESIKGHKDVSASNPSVSMSLDTPVYVPRNISCPGALADELAAALCGNQTNVMLLVAAVCGNTCGKLAHGCGSLAFCRSHSASICSSQAA